MLMVHKLGSGWWKGRRAAMNREVANWLMVGGAFAVVGSAALSLISIVIGIAAMR